MGARGTTSATLPHVYLVIVAAPAAVLLLRLCVLRFYVVAASDHAGDQAVHQQPRGCSSGTVLEQVAANVTQAAAG